MSGDKVLNEFFQEILKNGISKTAYKSGIKYSTIWSWVKRKQVPTFDKMQKVANAIGMEFLLFDKE